MSLLGDLWGGTGGGDDGRDGGEGGLRGPQAKKKRDDVCAGGELGLLY